jgi:hypothetical protein
VSIIEIPAGAPGPNDDAFERAHWQSLLDAA